MINKPFHTWIISPGLVLLLLMASASAQQPASSPWPPCQASPAIGSLDTLRSLSAGYFGDPGFDSAILLATNVHTADPAYKFISDRYHLPAGGHVCIPSLADGEHLRFNRSEERRVGKEGRFRLEPYD